jgi:signal transduction histidine kinase
MIPRRRRTAGTPAGLTGKTWVVGAVFVVAFGVAGSVVAARLVAQSDQHRSQRALAATSANVVSNLKLAIQHEEDLAFNATAFIVATPNVSNTAFNQWLTTDRAFARYPELVGIARIALIRAAQLPAYEAKAVKDPTGPLAPDGSFQVMPPGSRPFFCFTTLAGRSPTYTPPRPAGTDLCAGVFGSRLLAARDSGQESYEPFQLGPMTGLGIQSPLYRGGGVPVTTRARRAAFIGWVGIGLKPYVILNTALERQPDTSVMLRYARGSSRAIFQGGKAPAGAQSVTVDLHNGWTIRTSAAVQGSSVFSSKNAIGLLVGGISLSVLLGLLGIVLATGRTRALRLVREQTVRLRNQAATLRTTVDELEAANSMKDEFIALVSHELRTPLTSIRGYSELLHDENLKDEQHGYVEVIERNASRLLSLVERLLLMAKIQSGALPLELGEVVLADLIARSDEAAQPFAASKNITLEVHTEPGIAIEGDPVRLGQVIDNLVSNAIKYTPAAGIVSVTLTRSGDIATIAVADTGIGIPAAEQDQMFGRFFRTSTARDSGIQGSGLGLAITRGIVEAHGGTIDFESVEGKGTTFRVSLPHAYQAGLASAA